MKIIEVSKPGECPYRMHSSSDKVPFAHKIYGCTYPVRYRLECRIDDTFPADCPLKDAVPKQYAILRLAGGNIKRLVENLNILKRKEIKMSELKCNSNDCIDQGIGKDGSRVCMASIVRRVQCNQGYNSPPTDALEELIKGLNQEFKLFLPTFEDYVIKAIKLLAERMRKNFYEPVRYGRMSNETTNYNQKSLS